MYTSSRRQLLRRGRYSEPGRIYSVTIVAHERESFFKDWLSGRPVIKALRHAEAEGARTWWWVLMPDHLHWLMELQSGDLSSTVARLKSRSTVWFNRESDHVGRVWQKGFHDRALRKEEDLRDFARYLVMNPVRAGLVGSIRDYSLWDADWL